jgi:hypothetical protein
MITLQSGGTDGFRFHAPIVAQAFKQLKLTVRDYRLAIAQTDVTAE